MMGSVRNTTTKKKITRYAKHCLTFDYAPEGVYQSIWVVSEPSMKGNSGIQSPVILIACPQKNIAAEALLFVQWPPQAVGIKTAFPNSLKNCWKGARGKSFLFR